MNAKLALKSLNEMRRIAKMRLNAVNRQSWLLTEKSFHRQKHSRDIESIEFAIQAIKTIQIMNGKDG